MMLETNTRSVIFYGAGKYAENHFIELLQRGLVTSKTCFADGNKNKHFTTCRYDGAEIYIYPLHEAIARFPDYELYITLAPDKLLDVTNELVAHGVPQERIKYLSPVEKRYGCDWLGYEFIYNPQYLGDCCEQRHQKLQRTGEDDFSNFLKHTRDKIQEFRDLEFGDCKGCSRLKEGLWCVEPQISGVHISVGFPGDRCNFKCNYCSVADKFGKSAKVNGNLMDVIYPLKGFFEEQEISSPHIVFATGEFGMWRDCDSVLSFLLAQKWNATFLLTGSIYKQGICDLKNAGLNVVINISLDAGTAETHETIKRVCLWTQVLENIAKYAANGVFVELKYLLLEGTNDNDKDVDSFIGIAKQYASGVVLDRDVGKRASPMSNYTRGFAERIINEVGKQANLPVRLDYAHFHSEDINLLSALI